MSINRVRLSRACHSILNLILIPFLFCAVGCGGAGGAGRDLGGGIQGTSTAERTISGTLSDALGNPIPGASITVEESGDQAVTDDAGKYEIKTAIADGQFTLLVETANQSGEVQVQSVSAGSHSFQVDVSVSKDGAFSASVVENPKAAPVDDPVTGSGADSSDSNSNQSSTEYHRPQLPQGYSCVLATKKKAQNAPADAIVLPNPNPKQKKKFIVCTPIVQDPAVGSEDPAGGGSAPGSTPEAGEGGPSLEGGTVVAPGGTAVVPDSSGPVDTSGGVDVDDGSGTSVIIKKP